MPFRPVTLPPAATGKLYLTGMPGYREGRFEEALEEWNAIRLEVGDDKATMLCLTGESEIRSKSPGYYHSLQEGFWQGRRLVLPIPDFDIPPDAEGFHLLVLDLAKRIKRGETVIIHCAAGIGRTGTAAVCVLLALGAPLANAVAQVRQAGSGPETPEQRQFVERFSQSPLLKR
ncbi:MAG: tyrosine-protein phosphatase [Verrucomicrobium sp.]|nr:tyrosine-protein phosphatase [Verrucomicrobium sp.]